MKSADWLDDPEWLESLPVRGAWVEIPGAGRSHCPSRSLPVRGAWVEIWMTLASSTSARKSLPVRGAWVEMTWWSESRKGKSVAPRAGSVG